MKKVININFQGRVVPIEESAYDILKKYVESLSAFFANEDGRDEIINDIESRIAELFSETLKQGTTCITDDDVNRIIDSMGRPEDFEGEEANVKSQLGSEKTQSSQQQQSYTYQTSETKKLYRDENSKVLGGVCSGIANYFGIDPLIVRILFVIFFGVAFFPYLILWIAVPSSASTAIGSQRKRLFRDPDDKLIAGVCSGLAHYFGVNIWIPRLLFLIPFFSFLFRFGHWGIWDFPHFLSISFSPGATFIYIILWIVFPEAKSSADKLEMKGEKVDLNNIKNTIQSDMEGFSKRAEEFGKDISQKAQQFSKNIAETANTHGATTVKKVGRGIGDVIVIFAKIFAYFIIGSILFALTAALFGVGIVFTGFLPHKEFILNNGWDEILAWGTLMLFIWVPFIGLVTWIIRRIARLKGNSKLLRSVFIALWILGWVCFIGLIASVRNDFRYSNHPEEQTITLSNAKVSKLELRVPLHSKYYSNRAWFRLEPFQNLDDDTLYIQNTRVRIIKSLTDSFQVSVVKFADGSSRKEADDNVNKINYHITQVDSTLQLDRGIALTKNEKFRNQRIIITVAVPVGKKIKVDYDAAEDFHIRIGNNWDDEGWDWRYYENTREERWNHNVEYIMTEKGLQRTDKVNEDESDNSSNNAIDEFKKSKEQILREKEQKLRELQEIDKQLQDGSDSTRYHYQPDKQKKVEPLKKQSAQNNKTNIESGIDLLMMKFTM
jgi:phage shock protein PspC (stress-responsive transcriptional regulator)